MSNYYQQPKNQEMNKTKETKRRKKSYSYYGTGEWKLEPITEWQIRMWVDDCR